MSRIYFAYGSNLSLAYMRQTCPTAEPVGTAMLPGHRLAFTRFSQRWQCGVADVVQAPGMTVWGVLYTITPQCQVALDIREYNGIGYIRGPIQVISPNEEPRQAFTYKVIAPVYPELRPSEPYLYAISQGMSDHNLPPDYQQFIRGLWAQHRISRPFREGLLVGGYMPGVDIQLHPSDLPKSANRVHLHHLDHTAYAHAQPNADITPGWCQLGTALRDELHLPTGLYGSKVRVVAV